MKKFYTFLLMLAFFGWSMSAMAQDTYTIKGKPMDYHLDKDGFDMGDFTDLQDVIDAINGENEGRDIFIQLGDNTTELDLGGGDSPLITFTQPGAWALWLNITLTGKAKTTNSADGVIVIGEDIKLEIKAEISSSSGGILIENSGTLTLNEGKLKVNGTGTALFNLGIVNITGGEISTSTGTGIENGREIYISGGEVKSLSGNAVYNHNRLEISGGSVKSTSGDAVFAEEAAVYVSNGLVESSSGSAIACKGGIYISGGEIKAQGNHPTIFIGADYEAGILEITGGKISATTGTTIETSYSEVTISGGEISSTSGDGIMLSDESSLIVNNGKISTKDGFAIYINENIDGEAQEVEINGGMILAAKKFAIVSESNNLNIGGGIIFAYGTSVADIIDGDLIINAGSKHVFVAWDSETANPTYNSGDVSDIFKASNSSGVEAYWDRQGGKNGISVKNGSIAEFIPVEGVTIDGVGIASTSLSNQIQVFPNPTSGELRIENGELRISNVEIYDVFGRKIPLQFIEGVDGEAGRGSKEGWTAKPDGVVIDLTPFTAGIYFLKITTETGIVTKKIIKN